MGMQGGWTHAEEVLVRVEGEHPAAEPVSRHRLPLCDHPADRAVAVGQGIGKGAGQGLKACIDRHPRRPLAPVDQHLGPRADGGVARPHQDLIGGRPRRRPLFDDDPARRHKLQAMLPHGSCHCGLAQRMMSGPQI